MHLRHKELNGLEAEGFSSGGVRDQVFESAVLHQHRHEWRARMQVGAHFASDVDVHETGKAPCFRQRQEHVEVVRVALPVLDEVAHAEAHVVAARGDAPACDVLPFVLLLGVRHGLPIPTAVAGLCQEPGHLRSVHEVGATRTRVIRKGGERVR